MRKKDDFIPAYALSVYDVKQVEVGRKENEISKAPEALKLVEISEKVFTGDAMHPQKRLSMQILEGQGDFVFPVKENRKKCTKIFRQCLRLNTQSLVSEKSRPIF